MSEQSYMSEVASSPRSTQGGWHVLWTRSNCERSVTEQLDEKGYTTFLPMIEQWSIVRGKQHVCRVPMFKSYVFLCDEIGKHEYIDVSRTKGLVRILGPRWDRLAVVPQEEIETIKATVDCELPAIPFPYLEQGDHVRVKTGPLAGAKGIFIESQPSKGLLVVSVNLLQRSVAVELDYTEVEPI